MSRGFIVALGLGGMGLAWLIFGPGLSPGPNAAEKTVQPKAADSPPRMRDAFARHDSSPGEAHAAEVAALVGRIQQALDSKDPAAHAEVFEIQLPGLVGMDPWAAAQLAETSPVSGEWRLELMRNVAEKWAETDPQEAGNWAVRIRDPNERDTMLSRVCFKVADQDPRLAIEVLVRQGINNERHEVMLGNLAQQWASQDVPAAAAWARSCDPGKVRDALFLHIAVAQSRIAPEDAALIVSGQISPGAIQEEAAIAVTRAWAAQDADGATSWANRFPPSPLRDRALREISQISAAARDQTETRPQPH